jgi:hypothetical protein
VIRLVKLAKAAAALGRAEVVLFIAVLTRVIGDVFAFPVEIGVRNAAVKAGDTGRGTNY